MRLNQQAPRGDSNGAWAHDQYVEEEEAYEDEPVTFTPRFNVAAPVSGGLFTGGKVLVEGLNFTVTEADVNVGDDDCHDD